MTVDQIYKTRNIIKVSPEDNLSQALSLLSSSHDSAFVFEGDQFLGVVNPYYCLIRKSYPSNTKVKKCLVHPPKVNIDDTLERICQLMIESKIHYLPVFSDQRFLGIISARRLLTVIKDSPRLNLPILDLIKQKKPLVTVYEDDFIAKAINLFKIHRLSKLVVISKNFKLKGILTYFDLISYLITPKERQNLGEREGNKTSFNRRYVKNFMKTNVYTLSPNQLLTEAATLILEKEVGSVVVVDNERHPVGIITTKDLLTAFSRKKELPKIELVGKNLSEKSRKIIEPFIQYLKSLISKSKTPSSAKLIVQEKGEGGVFKAIVSLFSGKKTVKVIKKEGENLKEVIADIKKKTK